MITDGEATPATYGDDEIRITVSWKAEVYADAADRERARSSHGALTLDVIVARFMDDLQLRGIDADEPADPLADDAWTRLLADTYREPAPRIA